MTPNEVIASFIRSLPAPLRKSLCALLLGHLTELQPDGEIDVEREAIELVNPENPVFQFRAALCSAAVLDYLFAALPPDRSDEMLEAAERLGSETMKTTAMMLPLQTRYKDAARKKWTEIRRTELTHDRLADFERSLEMERMAKSTPIA